MLLDRRSFVYLGIFATLETIPAPAQPKKRPRIGILLNFKKNDPASNRYLNALTEGLLNRGLRNGINIEIEVLWGEGSIRQMRAHADALVARRPDVIVSTTGVVIKYLKTINNDIPVVFLFVGDPIGRGIVNSYKRPGGIVTGFAVHDLSLGGKWLQLLKRVDPRALNVSYIYNPITIPYARKYFKISPHEKAKLGINLHEESIKTPKAIPETLERIAARKRPAAIILPDPFTTANRESIIRFMRQHRIPAVYGFEFLAEAGGLMSYGVDVAAQFYAAADYVHRILFRQEDPGSLPVQGPHRMRLVLNLIEARTQGIEFDYRLLSLADRIIE